MKTQICKVQCLFRGEEERGRARLQRIFGRMKTEAHSLINLDPTDLPLPRDKVAEPLEKSRVFNQSSESARQDATGSNKLTKLSTESLASAPGRPTCSTR